MSLIVVTLRTSIMLDRNKNMQLLTLLSLIFVVFLYFNYFYYDYIYLSLYPLYYAILGMFITCTLVNKYSNVLTKYGIPEFFLDWHTYLFIPFVFMLLYYFPSLIITLFQTGLWTEHFDYTSLVFPITYSCMLFLFTVSFYLFRQSGVNIVISFLFVFSIILGASAIYEPVFNIFYTYNGISGFYYESGMFAFSLSAFTSMKYWKFSHLFVIVSIIESILFLLWYYLAYGIPKTYLSYQFLFNALTKIVMFLLFFLLIWEGTKNKRMSLDNKEYHI